MGLVFYGYHLIVICIFYHSYTVHSTSNFNKFYSRRNVFGDKYNRPVLPAVDVFKIMKRHWQRDKIRLDSSQMQKKYGTWCEQSWSIKY